MQNLLMKMILLLKIQDPKMIQACKLLNRIPQRLKSIRKKKPTNLIIKKVILLVMVYLLMVFHMKQQKMN